MEQLFGTIPSIIMAIGSTPDVEESLVFAAWRRVAGELLSERTKPVEYRDDQLTVAVPDETWRRHLEDLAPQFLGRINSFTGELKVDLINFQIDPLLLSRAGNKPADEVEFAADDAGEGGEIDESLLHAASTIKDPELRKTFLEAATVYLARQKKD